MLTASDVFYLTVGTVSAVMAVLGTEESVAEDAAAALFVSGGDSLIASLLSDTSVWGDAGADAGDLSTDPVVALMRRDMAVFGAATGESDLISGQSELLKPMDFFA